MHPEGARQALEAQEAAGAHCCHKLMASMKLPDLSKEEGAGFTDGLLQGDPSPSRPRCTCSPAFQDSPPRCITSSRSLGAQG